jgi:glutamate carboxypeptidase
MQSVDPMVRGAGDISFVAPSVNSLDGFGSGFHAPGESVDLGRLPLQSKRAALLIYRLTGVFETMIVATRPRKAEELRWGQMSF